MCLNGGKIKKKTDDMSIITVCWIEEQKSHFNHQCLRLISNKIPNECWTFHNTQYLRSLSRRFTVRPHTAASWWCSCWLLLIGSPVCVCVHTALAPAVVVQAVHAAWNKACYSKSGMRDMEKFVPLLTRSECERGRFGSRQWWLLVTLEFKLFSLQLAEDVCVYRT